MEGRCFYEYFVKVHFVPLIGLNSNESLEVNTKNERTMRIKLDLGNTISDITALAGLNNLNMLILNKNDIDNEDCPIINALISIGISVRSDIHCQ